MRIGRVRLLSHFFMDIIAPNILESIREQLRSNQKWCVSELPTPEHTGSDIPLYLRLPYMEYAAPISGSRQTVKVKAHLGNGIYEVSFTPNTSTEQLATVLGSWITAKATRPDWDAIYQPEVTIASFPLVTVRPKMKVGDYAEVRHRFATPQAQPYATNAMRQLAGQTGKIMQITERGFYVLDICPNTFWIDEWVRPSNRTSYVSTKENAGLRVIIGKVAKEKNDGLKNLRDRLNEMGREYAIECRKLVIAELKEVENTKSVVDNAVNHVRREIDDIKSDERVEKVTVESTGDVVIVTKPMTIQTSNITMEDIPSTYIDRMTSPWVIRFSITKMNPTAKRVLGDFHGYYHPHVLSNGSICYGNMKTKFFQALGKMELYSAWMITAMIIENYTSVSPYARLEEMMGDPRQCLGRGDVIDPRCESCRSSNHIDEKHFTCHSCKADMTDFLFGYTDEQKKNLREGRGKDESPLPQVSYRNMTIDDIHAHLEAHGVKAPTGLRKSELIDFAVSSSAPLPIL